MPPPFDSTPKWQREFTGEQLALIDDALSRDVPLHGIAERMIDLYKLPVHVDTVYRYLKERKRGQEAKSAHGRG